MAQRSRNAENSLPEVFVTQENDQIREPVYKVLNPIYIGSVWWPVGSIIKMNVPPNESVQPLNAAAGEEMARFVAALGPASGIIISTEDLMEAATIHRPKEGDPPIDNDTWGKLVRETAVRLKTQREGRNRPRMPDNVNVARAVRQDAPPMRNAAYQERSISMAPQGQRPTPKEPQAQSVLPV